jgi:hypothetical protein
MGCSVNRNTYESVIYDYWNSLPIVNTEIADYAEDLLRQLQLNSSNSSIENVFNYLNNKYFVSKEQSEESIHNDIVRNLWDKTKFEPEFFFWAMLLICKKDKEDFKSYSKRLFITIKNKDIADSIFKDDTKIHRDVFLKMLKLYVNAVSYHAVPFLVPEDETEKNKFLDFFYQAFQIKFQDRYIKLRIKAHSSGLNYIDFEYWLDHSYEEFDQNIVRDVLVCEMHDEIAKNESAKLQKITKETEQMKAKEKKILDELQVEEEDKKLKIEEEYRAKKEEEFRKAKELREERDRKEKEKQDKKALEIKS